MRVCLVRSRPIDIAVWKVAQALSQRGHEVRLLIWDRNDQFDSQNYEFQVDKFCLSAPYDRFRVLFYEPFWWIYIYLYLSKSDYEVVHAFDLDTLLPAILASTLNKKILFYSILDFSANNLNNGHFRPIRCILRRIIGSIEKWGIGFADTLFLVDKSRLDEIGGAKIKKVEYIYNSPKCTLDSFDRSKFESNEKFTIFYGGLIDLPRGIDHMIEAVNDLDSVQLILAGPIAIKNFYSKLDLRTDKIRYIGWLESYDDIIRHTIEADLIFRFSDPTNPKAKFESPNKLFEAMMCGRPIIVSDNSSMANIIREEQCGIVIPYGDVQAIKCAITMLKDNPQLRKSIGNNGRRAYQEKYSWNIMEQRLTDAYNRLAIKN